MNKSPVSVAPLGRALASATSRARRKGDGEELAQGSLLGADGVQVADAGKAAAPSGGSAPAASAGGGGGAAAGAGAVAGVGGEGAVNGFIDAVGSWLSTGWTWAGLGVVGAAVRNAREEGVPAQVAPTAADGTFTFSENATLISGQAPGRDANGDTLTYSFVGTPPFGANLSSNGVFSFPVNAADQSLDDGESRTVSFDYRVSDGRADSDVATVTIVITGANDAPVTGGAASVRLAQGAVSVSGNVPVASDVDGEAVSYAVVGTPPAGLTFNADGSFTYVAQPGDPAPAAGQTQTLTFQYVAGDGTATSAPATVSIVFTGANDAPVAAAKSVAGTEDIGVSSSVAATDADGDTLTYSVVGAAPAGVVFNADGTFSVTPLAGDQALDVGESRVFTFDYIASDGTVDSAPATVTVTLAGANDAPVSGGAASASGSEDGGTIAGSVPVATDVDGETLTYRIYASTVSGLTFNPDGTFSYVPQSADNALDDGETRLVTFQYRANDGTADSASGTVTITVSGANDAPVATASSFSGSENVSRITGIVPATDVDGETLTFALVGTAPAGLTLNPDGSFAYVPQPIDDALDVGESRTFTFDYTASDGTVTSAPATATVTVNGANDLPVTGGDVTVSGSEDDASIAGSVPAGSDVDGDTLTYALVGTAPAGLDFSSDGTFVYVPQAIDQALAAGETREFTFEYVANDGTSNSTRSLVTVTVHGADEMFFG